MSEKNGSLPNPGKPARYRIAVEGSLDESWSGRLGGMHITTALRDDQNPVTTLTGQIRDQAALMGVLNSLYQLHMNILSVHCTSCEQTEETS
ncbi:hypothetical protein CA13_29300 [Planctomycetes bacterium CA13]|uniref:Uncharacterized protein n=1 Tax=Novipirellula herctigrandis TaxID=2527986 RepID=A0A5C5Z3F1_9BACT|nr:hypothetical protein CA13_29300 [Planctomycetes bacterium CA13]